MILLFILIALLWLLARHYAGFGARRHRTTLSIPSSNPPATQQHTLMVVLGSGGHTAEMLSLVSTIGREFPYASRVYVAARGDDLSVAKAAQAELARSDTSTVAYRVRLIPRARNVGQGWWSTPWTTLRACVNAVGAVYADAPHLILCNGPGTCIPLCLAAAALKMLGLVGTRLLYVESFARVKRLSLSARIFYHLRLGTLVVQWPALQTQYPRSIYKGILI
ncbi:hypothetical protein AMAG_03018 [Allomyces macrogynus ATCC 38327]|uniref:UDP-N-acetylglucosamine transferase subunit ALG14 n=1 Tax=Allomyces macrogynus (strain ATCC 38327) TaxID=578462 RepID=A0A0L0S4F5_ALLM3|nr:hypothetical protein AMAG_03018 [Allomyces macrogynus ATCC 38327]|eukprot:KNE57286.1 hypothetical protein AMAG_03018 [Allomyces macrogynus ATCC 38327]